MPNPMIHHKGVHSSPAGCVYWEFGVTIMNLILFIVVLLVSFIAVRIGAIAFQLTRLEGVIAGEH
jgi:hypothetical protein